MQHRSNSSLKSNDNLKTVYNNFLAVGIVYSYNNLPHQSESKAAFAVFYHSEREQQNVWLST